MAELPRPCLVVDDHDRVDLLVDQGANGIPLRFVEVHCPKWPDHGDLNVIHIHPGPPTVLQHGWNVWHYEVVREPSGDAPGVLRINPSIGLQLVRPHEEACHLAGELPFVYRQLTAPGPSH